MGITDSVKEKLTRVYELVKRGENGEKEAAKTALERLLKKYNLSDVNLDSVLQKKYRFKYKTKLDQWLFVQLVDYLFEDKYKGQIYKCTYYGKELGTSMEYLDYVTLECAYEYFRRHMASEWKKVSVKELARKRSVRTKNKRRKELQDVFFSMYVQKSGIFHAEKMKKIGFNEMTSQEYCDVIAMQSIEGGNYHKQVNNGLMLKEQN